MKKQETLKSVMAAQDAADHMSEAINEINDAAIAVSKMDKSFGRWLRMKVLVAALHVLGVTHDKTRRFYPVH